MKRIPLVLFAVAFVSSLCFAQQPPPVKRAAPKPFEAKTFTGKVESVTLSDPAKGTKSEIVLVDDKGQKLSLEVRTTTIIYDKHEDITTLVKIMKDDKVVVEYGTTKAGINKAISIKVVE